MRHWSFDERPLDGESHGARFGFDEAGFDVSSTTKATPSHGALISGWSYPLYSHHEVTRLDDEAQAVRPFA
jgi:hypothetical protein